MTVIARRWSPASRGWMPEGRFTLGRWGIPVT